MNTEPPDPCGSIVLIVDDEKDVHYSFQRFLASLGCRVDSALSGEEALARLEREGADLVILDVKLGGDDGLQVLRTMRESHPHIPVIMMTAYGTTDTAIEATRRGAYDYVIKPFDPPRMKELVLGALRARHIMGGSVGWGDTGRNEGEEVIVGQSAAMQEVYKTIGRVADSEALVLIQGESGTGKELVARALYSHSHRKDRLFLPINCAALPESLLESELFGHEKGSFTGAVERRVGKFEQAEGGTIFLDEIGELPMATQAKLLRFLQDRSFQRIGGHQLLHANVRIIAATNKNLAEEVSAGRFRNDLYYRLKVLTIHIPPLRERREDIPALVEYFTGRYSVSPVGFTAAAIEALKNRNWPGNVRELENMIRRLILLRRSGTFDVGDLEFPEGEIVLPSEPAPVSAQADEGIPTDISEALDRLWRAIRDSRDRIPTGKTCLWIEEELAKRAMQETGGNQVRAAKRLGVSRNTLRQRLGLNRSSES
ncbi:MAG TPA: sigma-54 dependent transcriptional regulator [bacterium]|nr:sigma-54 dependent transcriptional regulator [bacterium]HQL63963.1 sigma-54 dependent transcriptional regulator [bacterium]